MYLGGTYGYGATINVPVLEHMQRKSQYGMALSGISIVVGLSLGFSIFVQNDSTVVARKEKVPTSPGKMRMGVLS